MIALYIILGLLGLYLAMRLASAAVFRSWFNALRRSKEGDDDGETAKE